jgi:hypothetical protein
MERDDFDRLRPTVPVDGESNLLYQILCHVDLHVMSDVERGHQARPALRQRLAALPVRLRMQIADVLFSSLRGASEGETYALHSTILQAIEEVCCHIQDLAAWNYCHEQMNVKTRFTTLTQAHWMGVSVA